MRKLILMMALSLCVCTLVEAKVVRGKRYKVGNQWVQAIVDEDSEFAWAPTQLYYLIDGKRVNIPPARVGFDPVFSAPGWNTTRGRIASIRFWEFDKSAGKRRKVVISYPGYRIISRGPWRKHNGGDTVPHPPD